MNTKTSVSHVYDIDVRLLNVTEYQRTADVDRVKKMVENYDPKLVGVITVSLRNGKYHVIDGQHRVMLCRSLKIPKIKANVLTGLTLEEEAAYFNAFNGAHGESVKLRRYDVFRADIIAKEPSAMMILKAATENGITLGGSSGEGRISAFSTLYSILGKYGADHLHRTLRLLVNTWNREADSFNAKILQATADFIHYYSGVENYSDAIFIRQLSRVDPKKAIREMKSDSSTSISRVQGLNILFKYYNHGLRKKIAENIHFRS